MPATPAPDLPPITMELLRQAYDSLQQHDLTFEQAMDTDMRRRLIVARAHQMRTQAWLIAHEVTTQYVRRVRLDAQGNAASWCTQAVMGPRQDIPQLSLLPPTT